MKSSGTGKTKKVTNKKTTKKVSTSPSSSNTKKKTQVKQKIKPSNKVQTTKKVVKQPQKQVKKKQVVRTNNHSAKSNVRLKPTDDMEYVPFLDGENKIEQVNINSLMMVAPDEDEVEDLDAQKPKKKIKPMAIIKFCIFIGLLIGLGYILFTNDTFNLETISVKGNEKYTEQDIIGKIDLKVGENVFKQLILSDRYAIDLAYVSKVSYGYVFPNSIVVKVKERYPAYIAKDKTTGKYYKLDNEGYLLEECDLSLKKEELIVEGFDFGQAPQLGKKIDESYVKKIETYNKIKTLLKEYGIQGEVTNVRFNASLTIVTLDGKLKITFANDSNLEYKVSFLKSIIKNNGGEVEGSIDMSVENPVYSKYN